MSDIAIESPRRPGTTLTGTSFRERPVRVQRERESLTDSDILEPTVVQSSLDRPGPVEVVLSTRRGAAPWLAEVAQRVTELTALAADWHASGAKPIHEKAALFAMKIVQQFAVEGVPCPDVIPVVDGSIQIEWDVAGLEIELGISGWHEGYVLVEDVAHGTIPVEQSLSTYHERFPELRSRLLAAASTTSPVESH